MARAYTPLFWRQGDLDASTAEYTLNNLYLFSGRGDLVWDERHQAGRDPGLQSILSSKVQFVLSSFIWA